MQLFILIIHQFRALLTYFYAIVLLLDEADIFLEERTLSDLERNSLVSGEHLLIRVTKFELTAASVFTHVRIL